MLREFPSQETRVETGPVRFGDDWAGIFIRGDEAFAYAMYLNLVLQHIDKLPGELMIPAMCLKSLAETLSSCDEGNLQFKQHSS